MHDARVRARVHDRPGSLHPARPPRCGRLRKAVRGENLRRPPETARALERLLAELRANDVVVVTRLGRLARSTFELLRIAETIEAKHAGLQSIAEPWADTTTPAGRMVLTVFAGIAEFERSLIATRTEEGRRAAQARGVPFGRPPKLLPEQRTLVRHLIEEGKLRQRSRPNLQCPCRNNLSLPTRPSGLMTVHRSVRTHGPSS